ncbi:MAG TPA: hypothetical protein PKM65_06975 [Spirochaetota bacterium]|nr:hypothetical protein [Spirochaetota bacterium]HNT09899.1 hypothetical protein [Spirochaetota bacterium]
MKRTMISFFSVLMLLPVVLVGQEPKKTDKFNFPSHSIIDPRFSVKNVTFNNVTDTTGTGETLQVEMELKNNVNDPHSLYVFVFATFEKDPYDDHIMRRPKPLPDPMVYFTAVPADPKNYEYPKENGSGVHFVKFPRDPKLGVDPSTKKPYQLTDNLFIKTKHHSKHRIGFVYFNTVTILVFDEKKLTDEKGQPSPVFRQVYAIAKKRR